MYTVEQQAEHRRLWIAALRSGEYKQARDGLAYSYGGEVSYCCLGVACEVAVKNGVSLKRQQRDDTRWIEYNDKSDVLPGAVRQWLGLDHPCGHIVGEPIEGKTSLTQLNDDLHMDFRHIADVIESNKLGLEEPC